MKKILTSEVESGLAALYKVCELVSVIAENSKGKFKQELVELRDEVIQEILNVEMKKRRVIKNERD